MGEQQQERKGEQAWSDKTSGRSSVADKPTNDEEVIPRGVTQKNQAQCVKPETELKTYTSKFYRAAGDHATVLEHYTKSHEFCTTSHLVLEMCLPILEARG